MTLMYDTAKQEQLYIEYHPKVLKYILYRVSNRSDAEDLASAVFLKVFKSLPSFDSQRSSISTWIYNITRNTVIDHFRRNRTEGCLDETETSAENVEESVIGRELLETLASALEKMDERERSIIVLHYYNEKTLSEIASAMNISYSYTKILHKKAINELKSVLL